MQQTNTIILKPEKYDWSGFSGVSQRDWCLGHTHEDGKPFNEKTLSALINRPETVGTGEGRKTRDIIRAALAEGLIKPLDSLDEAA